MDLTAWAAVVFALVIACVIAFQIALALGMPWGEFAMGGAYPGRFPPAMRVAALGQAVFLALVAVVVLSEARLALAAVSETFPWLIWLAVAFSGLSVMLNALSRSSGERRIWVPVALVLLAASLVVALTAG